MTRSIFVRILISDISSPKSTIQYATNTPSIIGGESGLRSFIRSKIKEGFNQERRISSKIC